MPWTRDQMEARAARELGDGYAVNLGIGIPTLVANHVPPGIDVTLQSENGILGLGSFPTAAQVDPDIINAGKQTITELDRTSYVSSADSFAMIRGGHIDLSVLGAMEVDEEGSFAKWMVPRRRHGPRRRRSPDHRGDGACQPGRDAQVPRGLHPAHTGRRVVDMIVTDLAVFRRPDRHRRFALVERAPGVSPAEVRARTEADYEEELG